mgnify:FL=1
MDRLNDVLGLEWSFSIKSSQSFEGKYFTEVQVLGALSYGPKDARETKEAFGFDTISWESKEGNQYPSPLDKAYKSAASNSMKLCARLCGVGNHLWGGDMMPETSEMSRGTAEEGDAPPVEAPKRAKAPTQATARKPNGSSASDKSIGFFNRLVSEKAWEITSLESDIKKALSTIDDGETPTQHDISQLIDALKSLPKPKEENTEAIDNELPF